MKKLIELRTPLCLIAVIGAVALLANLTSALAEEHHSKQGSTGPTNPGTPTPTPATAKGKSTGPTKPTPPPHSTDLRAKIAHMKLNEGSNVIHSEDGIKFTAEVKGGQITGYGATDKNGKPLVTTMERKGSGTPYPICWDCFLNGKGSLICVQVLCPARKIQ